MIIYDLANPDEFVDSLAKAINSPLNDPTGYLLAGEFAVSEKRPSVFISYSRSDRGYLDRLLVHLRPLKKDGQIDLWADTRLRLATDGKTRLKRPSIEQQWQSY